jgi:hypothetical protein
MATTYTALASQRFKRLDYRYDLVSGNVHRMSVQNGQVDQWHHAYQYDSDNRITAAYTNSRTPLLSLDRPTAALSNELAENDPDSYREGKRCEVRVLRTRAAGANGNRTK